MSACLDMRICRAHLAKVGALSGLLETKMKSSLWQSCCRASPAKVGTLSGFLEKSFKVGTLSGFLDKSFTCQSWYFVGVFG